jgi:hypothetical protein
MLLFAASVLVCAALVAANLRGEGQTEALTTAVASEMQPAVSHFSDEGASAEAGEGKLLGHVERNGEMVEVREMVADEEPAFGAPDIDAESVEEGEMIPDPASAVQPGRQPG